jgi:AraC-like DNA-binding protein
MRVEFVEPRSRVKTIERHFGCEAIYEAPRDAIVFGAANTQRRFGTRNAQILTMWAPQFEEELKQENPDENFADRMRVAIQRKLTGQRPTIEDTADTLHVSSCTLQRRLQEEGLNLQLVFEEGRHQLARYDLNNSVLELNEAAYLLGYEDANSFVRTFRTWEGFHRLVGENNSAREWRHNWRIYERRNNAKTQARKR